MSRGQKRLCKRSTRTGEVTSLTALSSGLNVPGLIRPLELAGGREALARQLDLRPQLLDSWLAGATPIPEAVFLKAVDLVPVPDR